MILIVEVEVFMGLQNRDYYRSEYESDGTGGGSIGDWSMVKKLLILTIAVFVVQVLSLREPTPKERLAESVKYIELLRQQNPDASEEKIFDDAQRLVRKRSIIQNIFELNSAKVMKGQIWRLLTYAFCHDTWNPGHILFNMLGLWWFGRTLEQMYGSREFLWFYLIAAFISGLAYVALDLATNQGGAAIGASGSILAALCLFAWHFPTQQILLLFVIPMQIRWFVVLCAVYDFYPVLQQLSGSINNDGVAHAAHAGGLLFGFLYGRHNWRLSSRFEGWNWGTSWRRWKSWFRRRPKLVLHRPNDLTSHQSSSTRLDELLAKISEQGEASLTQEERQFLIRESERLKRQR